MANGLQSLFPDDSDQRQAWRAYALAAHADLLLHELDQLDKLGHRVHPQQGQEPAIERRRVFSSALPRQLEQLNRLPGKGIDQPGDPALGPGMNPLDNDVVEPGEDRHPAVERRDRGDPARIATRLLYRVQVVMAFGQLGDLLWQQIGTIGRRVVVEHA